jgi:hypothetical protein
MKEHKFILSALISLMLCFSFSIDVYAQANVAVPTKVRTETKKPTKKLVAKIVRRRKNMSIRIQYHKGCPQKNVSFVT